MIDVVVIHNDEIERLGYLEMKLDELSALTKVPIRIRLSDSTEKLNPTKLDFFIRHYKLKKIRFVLQLRIFKQSHERNLKKEFLKVIQILKTKQMSTRKARGELDVTSKHIWAWRTFLDSELNHLVVLESDAIIEKNEDFVNFINRLGTFHQLDFISLSYPFSIEDLGLSQSFVTSKQDSWELKIQITNTAAGYVLSKALAKEVYNLCKDERPERRIVIDWLLNKYFLMLVEKSTVKPERKTIFPRQQIVINGSIVGTYESQLQE